jgi:SAM-dependent methyltransferase
MSPAAMDDAGLAARDPDHWPLVQDELEGVLEALVPLAAARIVEVGCGAARLARQLLQRHPSARVLGLEVDVVQLRQNLARPQAGLSFAVATAETLPLADRSVDGALMLKSLHHVPVAGMDRALAEVARVLRPGGWLYVSEPVYAGAHNEVVRLFNDEGEVREAAQAALDRALADGDRWEAVAECRFAQPVHYADWDDFARRMLYPSFADHGITPGKAACVRAAFERHMGAGGASFVRPMHVRVLRRRP